VVLDGAGRPRGYENPYLSFVMYDDEHHRVAFVDFGPLTPRNLEGGELRYRPTDQAGLHHVAFTFGSIGELLDTYGRLEAQGIRPFFCVNHGPTTSMYYTDPDGNRIELRRSRTTSRRSGMTTTRSCLRAPRAIASFIAASSLATQPLLSHAGTAERKSDHSPHVACCLIGGRRRTRESEDCG